MTTERTALVLGATGGIGGELARTLRARGWRIRALHRNPEGRGGGFEWLRGDAMSPADVTAAAEGARLIVHAVNPPGYRNWEKLVLPMLDSSIAAARAHGATILLPGTVYNYGPDAFPALTEDSPQRPRTRKGAIRVEMEARLRAAADGRLRALVVRAGDFFGPRAGNNWFGQGLVKPGQPPKAIQYPGAPGVGHQWAYLPDVAETMARLVEADRPEPFETFHMAGHWDPDGTAMIAAIRAALGRPDLPVRRFPWPVVRLAQPFVPFFRELAEMHYLWRQPIRMDNRRLVAAIGPEPHTPLEQAVRDALAGLGCLPAPGSATYRLAAKT
jgi:nucleoside-diphosphate-sugar epimerase